MQKNTYEIDIPPIDLIKFQQKIGKPIEISLRGDSMLPQLKDNDVIIVDFEQKYILGNIILFTYKNEGQLLHRIIKIKNGLYYCKGDNAFRIERILPNQILGKAVKIKRGKRVFDIDYKSPFYRKIICLLSILVNKHFINLNYDTKKCKKNYSYKVLQYLLKNKVVFL